MNALAARLGSWAAEARARLADLSALTKLRLNLLVLLAAAAGFCLGSRGPLDLERLVHSLLGILLVASGASALNQLFEREADARMRRTTGRPLPGGRISYWETALLGVALALAGTAWLLLHANRVAAGLGALTLLLYVFVYTPLKKVTPLNTLIGAFPGAMPPLIGWAAAGKLDGAAGTLFAIVFLWQMPHFYAIAWLHREDYARGGFKMLPVVEPEGRGTAARAVLYAAALPPIVWAPSALGLTGLVYGIGSLALSLGFLAFAIHFARARSEASARRLFAASVIYLPLLLALMILDKSA